MSQINLKKILEKIINLKILFIVFFLPIYFGLVLKTNSVFGMNKIVFFRILVLLLLFLSLVKFLFFKFVMNKNFCSLHFLKFKKNYQDESNTSTCCFFQNKNKILFLILLLIFTSLLISTHFSQNPNLSFWGIYERQQGLISYLYYLLFFILLFININYRTQIKQIIITIVLSSFPICVYGLAQIFGLDPMHWIESTQTRITGTFGQPNLFATYLLLVIPLTFYLLVERAWFLSGAVSGVEGQASFYFYRFLNFFKKNHKKEGDTSTCRILIFFYFLLLILQLICLFRTYSRGGWIGFVFGVFVTGVFFVGNKIFRREQKSLFPTFFKKYLFFTEQKSLFPTFFKKTLFPILFLLIILIIFVFLKFSHNDYFRQRVLDSFNTKKGSIALRLDFYKASFDAIRAHPWIGYGLDMQNDVLVQYYNSDWALHSAVNATPNRAHNLILDILLTQGFLGLFAYLLLFIFFLKLIIENIYARKEVWLNYALLCAYVSYLGSLFFNFSFIVGDVYLIILFVIAILINKDNFQKENDIFAKNQDINKQLIFPLMIPLMLLGLLIFTQIKKEFRSLIADYYFRETQINAIKLKNFPASFRLFGDIRDLGIHDIFYQKKYALMLCDMIYNLKPHEVGAAVYVLEDVLSNLEKSNNYDDLFMRAKIEVNLGFIKEEDEYHRLAREKFLYLIKKIPEMPRSYQEFGMMYLRQGDRKQAQKYLSQALDLIPELDRTFSDEKHRETARRARENISRLLENIKL